MPRIKKYFYNTSTHRFEKFALSWRAKIFRAVGFISASTVTALIFTSVAFRFLATPNEQRNKGEMQRMAEQYTALRKEISGYDTTLAGLEQRDNEIYRSIFEAAPLPDSVRRGKQNTAPKKEYAYLSSDLLIQQLQGEVSGLKTRIMAQHKSYDTLQQLVAAKEKMLAAIPAIQPVSNKDLSHIASGFGYRIDPIYKTPKLHTGLDFAAAIGTPVYATANGTVASTAFDAAGYGNHVILDHGYGYGTLYGHMVQIKVHQGETVKRGQVIGWVGSTGKSTGPHCHYEVIRNGEKIDPVHYFFNDLSAADYERMVKMTAAANQSFD